MNKVPRKMFKLLAIVLFLLAVASVLATLFAAPGSSRSPGLFLAVVLAGFGRWLLGKSQGKSAKYTFGRTIEVSESDDTSAQSEGPERKSLDFEPPQFTQDQFEDSIMSESPALSYTAECLLRIIVRRGDTMTDAVLVYRDNDDDIRWYGTDSVTRSDAVIMLEKVKQSLTSKS
jgi:hypothetical protein